MLKRGHLRVIGRKVAYALPSETASSSRSAAASEWEASRQAHGKQLALADELQVFSTELLHRVRNDLQLIHSVACASAKRAEGTQYAADFGRIGRQVLAMSELYNHLLGAGMTGPVDFGEYLGSLCLKIEGAENLAARGIEMRTELQSLPLGLNAVVTLGVVVNELVANAAKHAFHSGGGGVITVRLSADDADGHGSGVLSVSDDGRGLGTVVDQNRGLDLVRKLLWQAGCDLTPDDQGRGTAWRIMLP